MVALAAAPDPITEAQLRLPPVLRRSIELRRIPGTRRLQILVVLVPSEPRTRQQYRRCARWLELEAQRGYPSAEQSLRYARNMRWAAELAGLFGPGTWRELLKRSGHKNPEPAGARPKGDEP